MPATKKTRGGLITLPYLKISHDNYGNVVAQSEVTPDAPASGSYEESSGETIANFHKRKKRGELLRPTPWRQYEVSLNRKGNYRNVSLQSGYDTEKLNYWVPDDDDEYPILTASRDALETVMSPYFDKYGQLMVNEAAAAIYSRGHDSLTFLAELKKTASMFKDLKKGLYRLLAGKDPRQLWMQYRYSWRTLMYDIEDLSNAVQELGHARTRFNERQGRSFREVNTLVKTGTKTGKFSWKLTVKESLEISIRGNVTSDIQPPSFQFNPAITAWELTKLSFVLDWLINVGRWLETLSFLALQERTVAAVGAHVTSTREGTITKTWQDSDYDTEFDFTSHSVSSLTYRDPTSVSAKFPDLDPNLDVPKVLDLVSIFTKGKIKGSVIAAGTLLDVSSDGQET